MLSSPPRSNRSCWTSCKSARTLSGMASASRTPSALFSSSTAPIASMRLLSLATREPSPRPVLPESPVRVYILLSRLAIHIPVRRLLFLWESIKQYYTLASRVIFQPLALWHGRGTRIGTEFLQFELKVAMQGILPVRNAVHSPIAISRQRCLFDRFHETGALSIKSLHDTVQRIQIRCRLRDCSSVCDRSVAWNDLRRVQLGQLLQSPLPAFEIAVANIGNAAHRDHPAAEQHAGFGIKHGQISGSARPTEVKQPQAPAARVDFRGCVDQSLR